MRLVSWQQIQSLTGHNGAKVEGCQRHMFDMCSTTC